MAEPAWLRVETVGVGGNMGLHKGPRAMGTSFSHSPTRQHRQQYVRQEKGRKEGEHPDNSVHCPRNRSQFDVQTESQGVPRLPWQRRRPTWPALQWIHSWMQHPRFRWFQRKPPARRSLPALEKQKNQRAPGQPRHHEAFPVLH